MYLLEKQNIANNEVNSVKTKVATAIGLAGLSATAYLGQRYNLTEQLPNNERAVAESLAHPFIGYIGAFAANAISNDKVKRAALAIGGATALNFGVEAAQDAAVYNEDSFYVNVPETVKDYIFALGGIALYEMQDRFAKMRSNHDLEMSPR